MAYQQQIVTWFKMASLQTVPPQLRNARTQCDAHTWSINMGSLSQGYGWLAATVNRMGERIQICFGAFLCRILIHTKGILFQQDSPILFTSLNQSKVFTVSMNSSPVWNIFLRFLLSEATYCVKNISASTSISFSFIMFHPSSFIPFRQWSSPKTPRSSWVFATEPVVNQGDIQGTPLPVISRVITPINGLINGYMDYSPTYDKVYDFTCNC